MSKFNQKYEPVIGLEVHAQLLTETKLFCSCSTKFGNEPNTNICPVCLGHPGVLPVLNKKAVEFAIMMGIATNCKINNHSVFARKNYFYPDLPKGYQISQYEEPLCENGFITITKKDGSEKIIRIKRIHLEEDAGKSIHDKSDSTLIDVNRCGIPLIEIVSQPDINSPEEAYLYLMKIKQLVQYLEICDGNMEEGSLRCDANVSVRKVGDTKLGVKTEIKNMNSFRNVEKAIRFEIERQIDLLEDGEQVVQQTLLWNADLEEAYPMRTKEEEQDYRYFPDPDLTPLLVDELWLEKIKNAIPELPDIKLKRFIESYSIPNYDAEIITQDKSLANYYEKVVAHTKEYKLASNWLMVDVMSILNSENITINKFAISPENLAKLINLISEEVISSKIAKEVFQIMLKDDKDPNLIVNEKNLAQINDINLIKDIVSKVLDSNTNQVEEYLSGKEKVFGFFVGQIMKQTQGKANPQLLNKVLLEELNLRKK
ncbi:MAG: Asp-tRNA(Asn)/Glu-tRNA(Gln) amidotransferase subunit GatB [Ignavibacterium sp.]|nr:Asp-tRNA(Asn)/Glu-tRNA(Gln) amidotransferase subunit GatB [Ignavibacterium sp.]